MWGKESILGFRGEKRKGKEGTTRGNLIRSELWIIKKIVTGVIPWGCLDEV